MAPSPRQPQFGDRDYDLAAFHRDAFGGSLRWLATVLAVLCAALIVCVFTDLLPPDIHWPIHATGTTAKAILIGMFALWSLIAVVNWRAHARRGPGGPTAG